MPLWFKSCVLLLGLLPFTATAYAQSTDQTVDLAPPEVIPDMRSFYVPESLPALLIFELDSNNEPQVWNMRMDGKYLITERIDSHSQLLEYLREELTDQAAFTESFATYTRDSAGRSTPLFAQIGSPDQFYWNWEVGKTAVFSYEEPRSMDGRMASIRVTRERLVLPDMDTIIFDSKPIAVRFTSDLVRLGFLDKNGEYIGEDIFLEFRRYGKGVGLLGFTRQFSDGRTLTAKRKLQ